MGHPHSTRMTACRNNLQDIKNNQLTSNQVCTYTRIRINSILSFLQAILVISKLMSKAHRGRLLACRSNLTDMKNNRSSNQIQTFTRINTLNLYITL